METRLLLGEMPKLFAIVFTAVFCLRKLSSPISPEGKINAKSAEMSQGSGSEIGVKMVQGNFITGQKFLSSLIVRFDNRPDCPFPSETFCFGYQEI